MTIDRSTQELEQPAIVSVDETTRLQIEQSLEQWKDEQSEVRHRYQAFLAQSEEMLRPLSDAIRASELLSDRDFAIRINTRD